MKSFKSYLKEYGRKYLTHFNQWVEVHLGQYVPTADLNLRASKQAVSGNKVAKFVTGKNVTFQGKKYKEVDFEVLNVNNKTKRVEIAFMSPPN